MRLTHFLKRCVSAAVVDCPYDEIDEVETLVLKRSATNGATTSSFLTRYAYYVG